MNQQLDSVASRTRGRTDGLPSAPPYGREYENNNPSRKFLRDGEGEGRERIDLPRTPALTAASASVRVRTRGVHDISSSMAGVSFVGVR